MSQGPSPTSRDFPEADPATLTPEDLARSQVTVAELIAADRADPDTPDTFEVPLRAYGGPRPFPRGPLGVGDPGRTRDLHDLANTWRGLGLRVVEMAGWETRGREAGNTFECLGCHHTGSSIDVDRVLRDGRSDVPGPLCNVALHANGDVVLVASGRANHFGVATWPSGRALGVECTGPPFLNYGAYVKLAIGFCRWKGMAPTRVLRSDTTIPVYLLAAHKEVATPYGRKPNPAFARTTSDRTIAGVLLIDNFRNTVAKATSPGQEWWTVSIPQSELDRIGAELAQTLGSGPGQEAIAAALRKVLGISAGGRLRNPFGTVNNDDLAVTLVELARNSFNRAEQVLAALARVEQIVGPLSDDEDKLAAALAAMELNLSDADVDRLIAAFPGMDPEKIAAAVRTSLADIRLGIVNEGSTDGPTA